MNKQSMKFIRTASSEARDRLKQLGFQEVPMKNSNEFCFVNNTALQFAEDELPKQIVYTNIIHL